MTASLVEGLKQLMPAPLEGLPESMIHFFLDQDQWQGLNVADMLQVARPDWTACIPHTVKHLAGWVERVGDTHAVVARALRFLSKSVVEGMLLLANRGQRTSFSIPQRLQVRWALPSASRFAPLELALAAWTHAPM